MPETQPMRARTGAPDQGGHRPALCPPALASAEPAARGRLRGVDLARWLAVAGMLVIHFGVPFLPADGPTASIVANYAWGRSTILFAFLAGVSLALVTGHREPHRGSRARTGAARVALRGGALLLTGWILNNVIAYSGSTLTVIITYYGLYFLLAVPFLRLRAGAAAVAAAVAVLTGPQVLYLLRRSFDEGGAVAAATDAASAYDPGHLLGGQGVAELAVHGYYPALTYMAAVLAGLAVGRLDLRSGAVRLRVTAAGMAAAFVAYRTSWHAWYNYGLFGELGAREEHIGAVPTDDARWLLTSLPHTATTPEVLGGIGVSMAVLAGCLHIAERLPRSTAPFCAAGSMALTVYVVHALVMAWQAWLPDDTGGLFGLADAHMAEVYLVASLVCALLWRRTVGRGPLEAAVSSVAKAVAPGPRSPAHARKQPGRT